MTQSPARGAARPGETPSADPGIDALTDALEARLPRLDELGRSLALELYRALARGAAVSTRELADRTGQPSQAITEVLQSWRDVVYDHQVRVVGFWGLTILPTPHVFETADALLYTWCAWDALFLPSLLDATARVVSTDPSSGQRVELTVTPTGIAERSHPHIVVSFAVPDGDACATDVRTGFCQHVHFFVDESTARRWIPGHDGRFTLDLDAAYDLGQRRNHARGLA